jgi:2-desacetyl-2-hydroxyethyl bacteriochlorophyllide A dehydrogenase
MPQRIIFPAKGQVALQDFELPVPGPGDLKIRTLYSLMSIGTETIILHQKYAPDSHFARMFSFPQLKTGVQAIGKVEQVGAAVKDFAVGDTVFMRMAHGSHQVLPADRCSPVPDGVDLRSACWCGLAKTAFRAAWAGRFELGGHVLIIGAGPVGQMAIRWAKTAGLGSIVVVDLSAFRLEHARRGGALRTLCGDVAQHLATIREMNEGKGPALIIDTTGNPAVFQSALSSAAMFGKVVLLGDTGFPGKQCLTSDVMTKGLTIQATHDSQDRDGWTQRRIDRLFFRSVQEGRFDLAGLITHEFSPEECAAAYTLAEQQREQAMGILFDWGRVREAAS